MAMAIILHDSRLAQRVMVLLAAYGAISDPTAPTPMVLAPPQNEPTTPFQIAAIPCLHTIDDQTVGLIIVIDPDHALQADEMATLIERATEKSMNHISHTLRTPLTSIKGYASAVLALASPLDSALVREYAYIILHESEQLEHSITTLLAEDQSAPLPSMTIESIQIDELVRQAVTRWQAAHTHHFELHLPAQMPPIPGSAAGIEYVLDEILNNVVRHTPPQTHATIDVGYTRTHVIISVCDNGPGVAEQRMPFLFDLPSADEPASNQSSKMGLVLCKSIVEQHGGKIMIESHHESGTKVRLMLPRRRKGTRSIR